MAEQERRGAYVGLAAASALVVLVASVVAVNRIGSGDGPGRDRPQVAAAPLDDSAGSVSTPDSAVAADAGSAAGSPDGALASASTPSSGTTRKAHHGQSQPGRPRGGSPSQSTGPPTSDDPSADPSARPASTGTTGGQPAADPPSGSGGTPAGEQPPSGGKEPPGNAPLVAASVSAGQGDQGGVVRLGFGEGPDADVTVGTTQIVGDAPPSSGTGVGLGGGIFDSPPSIPILSG